MYADIEMVGNIGCRPWYMCEETLNVHVEIPNNIAINGKNTADIFPAPEAPPILLPDMTAECTAAAARSRDQEPQRLSLESQNSRRTGHADAAFVTRCTAHAHPASE